MAAEALRKLPNLPDLALLLSCLLDSSQAHRLPRLQSMSISKIERLLARSDLDITNECDEMVEYYEYVGHNRVTEDAMRLKELTICLSAVDEEESGEGMLLEEFPQFGQLPLELRLKIWEKTLPVGPRIIELYQASNGKIRALKEIHKALFNLLGVCKESKELVEKYYVKISAESLGLACKNPGAGIDDRSVLLVNPEGDILFLNGHRTVADVLSQYRSPSSLTEDGYCQISDLTTLALRNHEFGSFLTRLSRSTFTWLRRLTNLKNIILLQDNPGFKGSSSISIDYVLDTQPRDQLQTDLLDEWNEAVDYHEEDLCHIQIQFAFAERARGTEDMVKKLERITQPNGNSPRVVAHESASEALDNRDEMENILEEDDESWEFDH